MGHGTGQGVAMRGLAREEKRADAYQLKENEAYGNTICLQSNEAYKTVKQ